MRNALMLIPIMTLFANIAILLDIPILRETIVFIFLSFVPGFAILRLFKLKEISFLDTILFSVALSIAFVMFMGLLVNELYLFLGLSPLSTVPLTVAISAFTLTVFFIEYRRDLSETLKLKTSFEGKLKKIFPLSIILFLPPLLSAIGVLYLNVFVILLSYAIIAALCVMSVVSRRLVPENLFPFLIFSISIALVCLVPLTSKYIVGYDANLEYYVFRLTQINGHWGFLNANVNSSVTLTYDSMLSITLLPAVYSALMHAQGDTVFKILYPFILSLVPLTLYRICEKQFGKLIGLLSALFFVFTYAAFFGVEILSLNRQIVGELFFILSIFLLISKTIPVTKRRLLLIIFGAALAVSHYSLAYIYLAIVALVFIVSRVKPRFDDTLNTVTVLLLFVMTFSWYALTSAPLISLTDSIKGVFVDLTTGVVPTSGTASAMFFVPQVFTVGIWINLLLSGIANLFLIIGVLSIILRPKGKGISAQFAVMLTIAAVVLAVSLIAPTIASTLNFTRFYGITLLFLSPCFVFGGQTLLVTIRKAWTKIKRPLKRQIASKSKNIDIVFLLIAIILSAYFLSQVGFVNRVTNSAVVGYTINLDRMITSNESQVKISLYGFYIPEQEVFSASWLLNHKVETAEVFGDFDSETNVLVSYGLIPNKIFLPITNTTIPPQGSFVYLGSLNVVNGVIATTTGSFNTSEISFLLDQNNLVYSNGNSEIWYVAPAH
jgi:uncharacterized membrane protein